MQGVPKKLKCVLYRADVQAAKKQPPVLTYVVTGFYTLDVALARAREVATRKGYIVKSANFCPGTEGGLEGIALYVTGGSNGKQ